MTQLHLPDFESRDLGNGCWYCVTNVMQQWVISTNQSLIWHKFQQGQCNGNVISVSGSKFSASLYYHYICPHHIWHVTSFATILVGSPIGGLFKYKDTADAGVFVHARLFKCANPTECCEICNWITINHVMIFTLHLHHKRIFQKRFIDLKFANFLQIFTFCPVLMMTCRGLRQTISKHLLRCSHSIERNFILVVVWVLYLQFYVSSFQYIYIYMFIYVFIHLSFLFNLFLWGSLRG